MKDAGEVRISFKELSMLKSETSKRALLKEKGLPMKGNFFPEMRQDYKYRLEYDFKNSCEIYYFRKEI